MKEQIVLKAKVDIDFEYILKLIQDGIKDDVETGYLEKERLEECLVSIDHIHNDFCEHVEDYLNEVLPFDNAYDNIYELCGIEGIDKIKYVFWEWLVANKKKYGLQMKKMSEMIKDPIIVDISGYEGLPHVKNLGDGVYTGKMAGHSFIYDGVEYYSEVGVRCPFYVPETVTIKNGEQVY